MDVKQLRTLYQEIFHEESPRVFFAPGRINLIGEHTDYNGGHVFPCAITKGTYALASKRSDKKIRMYSVNFKELGIVEFELENLDYEAKHEWANYPKGMLRFFKESGCSIGSGFDVLFYGNIPNGAGLSSSASIELVTGVLLDSLFELNMDRIEMVKIGQQVENKFIGVNSGIMDQFAIGMGRKNAGILLNCDTLEYEYAPIELERHSILIMNTNKRRELADSKYNERRSECEQALALLQKKADIQELANLTPSEFDEYQSIIDNEVLRKRAKHVVYENSRTLEALKELKRGNLEAFGELMNQSHLSLKDDYEVTGTELDTLAETAWKEDGVLGARMTGAGFGGCAIAIVETDKAEAIMKAIGKVYKEKIGYEAEFYQVLIGDGAKELKEVEGI
ncbi:galactokinase [Bacillus sp. MUM 13]|uniref:galactokinase n=1 Tax=Bacillus sp. MUM 13 TaxID=1678001 RepID=UPI0008F5F3D0|nr:galactokinase [Bacillus sp. MUM 13]OIK12893.1 galactokinase [Bacillus sp. MUM 13]